MLFASWSVVQVQSTCLPASPAISGAHCMQFTCVDSQLVVAFRLIEVLPPTFVVFRTFDVLSLPRTASRCFRCLSLAILSCIACSPNSQLFGSALLLCDRPLQGLMCLLPMSGLVSPLRRSPPHMARSRGSDVPEIRRSHGNILSMRLTRYTLLFSLMRHNDMRASCVLVIVHEAVRTPSLLDRKVKNSVPLPNQHVSRISRHSLPTQVLLSLTSQILSIAAVLPLPWCQLPSTAERLRC